MVVLNWEPFGAASQSPLLGANIDLKQAPTAPATSYLQCYVLWRTILCCKKRIKD